MRLGLGGLRGRGANASGALTGVRTSKTWLASLFVRHVELVGERIPRAGDGELRTVRDIFLVESNRSNRMADRFNSALWHDAKSSEIFCLALGRNKLQRNAVTAQRAGANRTCRFREELERSLP
jgi:hypothetical protein